MDLLGEARGEGARGDASRLGMPDQGRDSAARLETEFRQLRRLARAGCATDDDRGMARQSRKDLVPMRRDGQRRVVLEP